MRVDIQRLEKVEFGSFSERLNEAFIY